MSESTVIASSVAIRPEATVLIFDNHLPLRTRQAVHDIWLGYAYLDFGGNYFRWCACSREPGKYHCWHQHNPAYSDGHSTTSYLGLFSGYTDVLPLLDRYDDQTRGEILARLAEPYSDGKPGEIELPEC